MIAVKKAILTGSGQRRWRIRMMFQAQSAAAARMAAAAHSASAPTAVTCARR